MSCQRVRKSISLLLDQELAGEEQSRVVQHLGDCRECATYLDDMNRLRSELRHTAPAPVPDRLAAQLRVLASHESARRLAHLTWANWFQAFRERLQLLMDNMARPMAIPAAGGLLSALFIFALLVPTLGFRHNFRDDVPIGNYTEPTLFESAAVAQFNFDPEDDAVVELTIDERGQIQDFSLQRGKMSRDLEQNIGNLIYFTSFSPATWFGRPYTGKILVSFRHTRIVIKG